MTDEELHQMEIRYSDMESWDDAKQLVIECRRLRADNQRLVAAIRENVEDCECDPCCKLRATIEGK